MRNNIFKSIKLGKVRRNAFDLGHEKKLSMKFGDLIPIYLEEILPGDKFRVSTEHVLRFAPMIAPVMHRVNVYIHYFFVPNRLVFKEWPTFITGGTDGKATIRMPVLDIAESRKDQFKAGSLADYFGIPPIDQSLTLVGDKQITALPFRAYQRIYNDYYRDQTLTPEVGVTDDQDVTGAESISITTLRKRSWEKDYFTSALPWTQRGNDVNIPMEPVYSTLGDEVVDANTQAPYNGTISAGNGYLKGDSMNPLNIENITEMSATVNDLRTSIRLQEWLEKNARAGSRYIEQILAHWGVRTPDYRLQRSEYLGGGKSAVQISEVLANFGNAEIPQGNMAGHGLSVSSASGFTKYFQEHGYVIGIMSVMPTTAYYQGVEKHWNRFSRYDYAWPEFAHLGEQPVLKDELFLDEFNLGNNEIFGYQSRFAEYKHKKSSIHGDFRDTLEFWHLGRKFDTAPDLNDSFISCDASERIFAVDDVGATDKIYVQLYNDVKAIRPLPVFGTPML